MMFLEQNLAAIKRRDPNLAEAIKNTPITGRYKLMKSSRPDGAPTIIDVKLNKNYYNSFDPIFFAKQNIESRDINLPYLAVFLGFGAGYQIIEYMNKYPNGQLLIVEKELEIMKLVFTDILLTDVINYQNATFLVGEDLNLIYPKIFDFFNRGSCLPFLSSLNVIDLPAAISSDQQYYITIIRIIKEAIGGVMMLYGNDPYDSLLGIKFTLQNISTIIDYPGVKDLEGVFKGKPGVVVATGPSLDKNVHLLKDIYNKAVIIGADASAKVLKKKGLKPAHMVTSLERALVTSKLFEGLTEEDVKDSYLAACPVVVPETYANFPGEKIIVYRNFATFEWLSINKGTLNIGPSSGNMAFKILEFLGCDPIILIGQDLSYANDFRSHADGFHYGIDSDKTYQSSAIRVPGNYEPEVFTTQVWYSFLKHYERDLAEYKGKVINATEGGARIVGSEIMTFAEAIEKYIDKDINVIDTIKKHLKQPSKKIKINQEREVLKKLYHAKEFCTYMSDKLKAATQSCKRYEEMLAEFGDEPDSSQQEKLDSLIINIENAQVIFNEKDFYLILMHYVQSFYIKSAIDLNYLKFSNKPSLALDIKRIQKFKEMYSVLAVLIDKMNDEFEVSIKLLEKYRDEVELAEK